MHMPQKHVQPITNYFSIFLGKKRQSTFCSNLQNPVFLDPWMCKHHGVKLLMQK
jgi:hypothetical protein